jgi:hypothetical protein
MTAQNQRVGVHAPGARAHTLAPSAHLYALRPAWSPEYYFSLLRSFEIKKLPFGN